MFTDYSISDFLVPRIICLSKGGLKLQFSACALHEYNISQHTVRELGKLFDSFNQEKFRQSYVVL
jgi:hypothetical protein